MVDSISASRRSENMRRIRGQDTKPELVVRRHLHRAGFRYKLHDRSLPGSPDIVFPRRKKVIFVHGCFWHQHPGCKYAYRPKSRLDFWLPKLDRNRDRDRVVSRALTDLGWDVLTIWECEVHDSKTLDQVLKNFICDESGGLGALGLQN